MKDKNKNSLFFDACNSGFYSEYLPKCFTLDEKVIDIFNNTIGKNNNSKINQVLPLCFKMSRKNKKGSRREIYIPEIAAYLSLFSFIDEYNILDKFIDFTSEAKISEVSFSKITDKDKTRVLKHEEVYEMDSSDNSIKSTYIDNIVKKLIKSKGSKKVLKIDISNCFRSFYTHYIPAIFMGYKQAIYEYENKSKRSEDYKVYSELDRKVRQLNMKETKGILPGPKISRILAEGILSRIDTELIDKGINYTRYMDDYDVYLIDDNEEEVISVFAGILNKYGFNLNYEKTEIQDFPFYVVNNFKSIFEKNYSNNNDSNIFNNDVMLLDIFNTFFNLEKETDSAIKFLIKFLILKVNSDVVYSEKNIDLLFSYLFNLIRNDSWSLPKSCELIIKILKKVKKETEYDKLCISKEYVEYIEKALEDNLSKEYELEAIWLLYLLLITNNVNNDKKIINMVINSKNSLCKALLLNSIKFNDEQKKSIIKNDSSWLLDYELFFHNFIDETEFKKRLNIKNNTFKKHMLFYTNLKNNKINFVDVFKELSVDEKNTENPDDEQN